MGVLLNVNVFSVSCVCVGVMFSEWVILGIRI